MVERFVAYSKDDYRAQRKFTSLGAEKSSRTAGSIIAHRKSLRRLWRKRWFNIITDSHCLRQKVERHKGGYCSAVDLLQRTPDVKVMVLCNWRGAKDCADAKG